jgi:hypothetical protein
MSQETDERGFAARRILNEPVIMEAFTEIDKAYHEILMSCPARDSIGRDRVIDAIKIVAVVKEHLVSAVATQDFSAKEAEQVKKLDDSRVVRFMRSRST